MQEVPALQVDKEEAVTLSQKPQFHCRPKHHIAKKYFLVRQKVSEDEEIK